MTHLPQIIQDLALILVVAAFVSLTFKKLKQPVVLGYLVAGMLVGPHQEFLPKVTDLEGINLWAEIGVIFLLFAIGLEFSFRKLMSVGASAGITATFQVVVMVILGFLTGRVIGWDWMNSMFLGAVISISSTTIVIKTFEEMGLKGRRFANLVVGILIFEDLAAVLIMVLLSTLAISREFHGVQMFEQMSRLIFFLCLWFMVGVFILPNVVKRIRHLLNPESTLIVSLGLCFLMVVLATKAGFSPALGAFVMGSLLAETSEGEKIEHVIMSVKNLFSAIFFVSVGMLIDPNVVIEHWGFVLGLSAVLIFGKVFSITFGSLISGQNLKTSVQAGMSLAQIGEFSYIIATLGVTLKVTNELLYPIAVAVSVLTTFTSPYMVKGSEGMYTWLVRILPPKVRRSMDSYSLLPEPAVMTSRREYLKNYSLKLLLNTVIVVAIFLTTSQGLLPWLETKITQPIVAMTLSSALTILLAAPFLWALAFSQIDGYSFAVIWKNRGARSSVLFLSIFRGFWGLALLSVLITQFIPQVMEAVLMLGTASIFLVLFSSKLGSLYAKVEARFLKNLRSKKETEADPSRFEMPPLAPWDAHLVEFIVPQEADYVGTYLEKLSIRERYGVTVALIRRGEKRITAPGRNEMLMPLDHIFVIGTDEQLLKFKKFLDQEKSRSDNATANRDYTLEQYMVPLTSEYLGKTIRHSGLREATKGIVVGVERSGKRFLNPDSGLTIEVGDLLWIVGDRRLIRSLN
ncbi:MAG: cation:proton antiporter [Bdellovibrionaceae bacterium]|nr:cation:proton antiporter [Pseudobdellovibrionaceae bacterium]